MSADNIEVGTQIWSDSRQDGRGQIGGVVIEIGVDGNGERCYTVIEAATRELRLTDIVESDVRAEATTFQTRNAAVAAQQIHRHLTSMGAKADRVFRARLASYAATLELVAAEGPLTAGAERRYQAERLTRRDADR